MCCWWCIFNISLQNLHWVGTNNASLFPLQKAKTELVHNQILPPGLVLDCPILPVNQHKVVMISRGMSHWVPLLPFNSARPLRQPWTDVSAPREPGSRKRKKQRLMNEERFMDAAVVKTDCLWDCEWRLYQHMQHMTSTHTHTHVPSHTTYFIHVLNYMLVLDYIRLFVVQMKTQQHVWVVFSVSSWVICLLFHSDNPRTYWWSVLNTHLSVIYTHTHTHTFNV